MRERSPSEGGGVEEPVQREGSGLVEGLWGQAARCCKFTVTLVGTVTVGRPLTLPGTLHCTYKVDLRMPFPRDVGRINGIID